MERSYKSQQPPPRHNVQRHFRPAFGPPQFGRFNYRGTFQGPVPRPMPIHPHESHREQSQFQPIYSHSPGYRGEFFSPPRARQTFHHEGTFGEFTPPRPFHGWNEGRRQNSSKIVGHGECQRPGFKKGNTRYNSHKYFKESMLEDPWKEITEKRKLEQITKNT